MMSLATPSGSPAAAREAAAAAAISAAAPPALAAKGRPCIAACRDARGRERRAASDAEAAGAAGSGIDEAEDPSAEAAAGAKSAADAATAARPSMDAPLPRRPAPTRSPAALRVSVREDGRKREALPKRERPGWPSPDVAPCCVAPAVEAPSGSPAAAASDAQGSRGVRRMSKADDGWWLCGPSGTCSSSSSREPAFLMRRSGGVRPRSADCCAARTDAEGRRSRATPAGGDRASAAPPQLVRSMPLTVSTMDA